MCDENTVHEVQATKNDTKREEGWADDGQLSERGDSKAEMRDEGRGNGAWKRVK